MRKSGAFFICPSSRMPDTMSGNVSSIAGNVKGLGFYAFSQQEGEPVWKLTAPEKHIHGLLGSKGNYPTQDFKQLIMITESGVTSYEL